LRVEVYPEVDKLGKQFKYASSRGIGFVTVVGGDERAAGQVTIKNLATGDQAAVARDGAASWLQAAVRTT
jgi:histidyl-tRNA synthetase